MRVDGQLRYADRSALVAKLAASFVHDVGTPLNVISGCASLISEGVPDAKKLKDYADKIADQTNRIHSMIRHFLDFAQKESPERPRTSLLYLVRESTALFESIARKNRVRLRIAEGRDVEARVDPGQIQHAFADLLINAIEAMPEGGRATVTLSSRDGAAAIEVQDEGPGIPDADRERVFEPFFTTKTAGRGTGLGLSVAKSIIEIHGGRIELSSAPEGGSRFTLHLPHEGAEP